MGNRKIKTSEQLYFDKNHEMIRQAVRDFVKKEINPNMDEWEDAGIIPLEDVFRKMGELGFLGIRYGEDVGGQGLDGWADLAFLEEILHCQGGSFPMATFVQTHMATPAIYEFGSSYLKEAFLKPAIKGEKVAAIAVTEPDAGSDVASLRTFAKKEGNEYVINGSKTYITNGTQADFLTLLARTSEEPGYHSFSLIVVPTDLPGFSISKKLDKMGMRASDNAELFFDNVRVPEENVIGEPGEGFILQMKQFQHERFTGVPIGYIVSKDVINLTLEHIRNRKVFGEALINKQVLRHRIAKWLAEIESLKCMAYHIVQMKEAGLDASREITMAKLISGRLVRNVADGCLQMFGGMGYMNENLITRYYRDARIVSIGGGADEVMCEIITKMEKF